MSEVAAQSDELAEIERGSPFFRSFAEHVLRFRWLWLLLIAAVTAGSVYAIKHQLMVDNSVEAFGSTKDDSMDVLEAFRDVFGHDEMFVVLVEGPVFTTGFLEKLDKLHSELDAMDIEVPSLGERKRDRDEARGKLGIAGASGDDTDPEQPTG